MYSMFMYSTQHMSSFKPLRQNRVVSLLYVCSIAVSSRGGEALIIFKN
jgi:hypothetical protein